MLLRDFYTESAVVLLVAEVGEQLTRHASNAFSRAQFLHLTLGCSKGVGALMVFMLVLLQMCAAVSLLVPRLYLLCGVVVPAAILSTLVWCEAIFLEDVRNNAVLAHAIIFSATSALVALFRYDRRARNIQLQVPNSSYLLTIENVVKRACTAVHTRLYCPPMATCVLLHTLLISRFTNGNLHALEREYARATWSLGMAAAALLLLLGAQDTRRSQLWRLHDALARFVDKYDDFDLLNERVQARGVRRLIIFAKQQLAKGVSTVGRKKQI